nr:hypothetical protein [Tanacetum cinerariifolium]
MTAPTMTPSTIATTITTSQAPILPTTVSSTIIQNLPNFGSLFGFDNRLRTLEANFAEFMQTNQFAGVVSAIPGIVQRYMDQWMNEAFGFDNRLRTLEANFTEFMQTNQFAGVVSAIPGIVQRYMDQWMNEAVKKIIKEQVKEQVKVQVSKILSRIEQTMNKQLEAKVLTRSSHSSKTSYAVAADLSEMELKKILIEKIDGNKTLRWTSRGSKRRREGNEPESASALMETATRSAGRDDHMFSTIKLVSRHQNTQQFGALLPIELTNEEIMNSNAYKVYYEIATGPAPPKPKASVRRTRSSFDTSITPPTTAAVTKRSLQQMHISQASGSGRDEGTGSIPGVPDVPSDECEEELSWNSTDNKGANDKGKDGDGDEEDEGDDGEEGDGDDDDEDDDGEDGNDD